MATKPVEGANPLAPFVALSECIYLCEPTTTMTTTGASSDRKTATTCIVLTFWMNAPPRALVKYVSEYARRAPTARIIFILSWSSEFSLRLTARAQRRRLIPAVEAIRASSPAGSPILLHLFSNGGLFTAAHLLLTYRRITGHAMPLSSMIIDSAPGRASFATSSRALSFALPQTRFRRLLGVAGIYVLLLVLYLWRVITGAPDIVTFARTRINDPDLVGVDGKSGRARNQCYIYSETDDLIPWQDVEKHAAEAEATGWVVRREKFSGSPHVGHMRADPARYWGIIESYLE
jgi:Eukaryotic protein of unknown function (DUF829)